MEKSSFTLDKLRGRKMKHHKSLLLAFGIIGLSFASAFTVFSPENNVQAATVTSYSVQGPSSIQSKVYPDGTWVTFTLPFTTFPPVVYRGDLSIGDIPYITYGANRTGYYRVDGGYVASYRGQIYSW